MRRALMLASALLCTTCAPFRYVEPRLMPPVPSGCGGGADLSAVTFNAGLGPGIVRYSTPRAGPVAAAVAATDADVLCLQEVWMDEDRDRIVSSLGLPPENVYWVDTAGMREVDEDRCGSGDLGPLLRCVRRECAGTPAEETTNCAMSSCGPELLSLYLSDEHCLHCLASAAGNSVAEIRRTCGSTGASRIYGGRNGVILASRWPLVDREHVMLPATGANRVALIARVRPPGSEPIEVACTHITSPQRIPPSHSGYGDWNEEQIAQVRMISERLRARAGSRPTLFLGDMNTGRADGPDIDAAALRVWAEIVGLGFASPAGYADPPFCTACSDNLLRGGSGRGYLIDHVLTRDPPGGTELAPVCVERLFDRTVDITGYRGEPVTTHLSDHYGVRVRFDLR